MVAKQKKVFYTIVGKYSILGIAHLWQWWSHFIVIYNMGGCVELTLKSGLNCKSLRDFNSIFWSIVENRGIIPVILLLTSQFQLYLHCFLFWISYILRVSRVLLIKNNDLLFSLYKWVTKQNNPRRKGVNMAQFKPFEIYQKQIHLITYSRHNG